MTDQVILYGDLAEEVILNVAWDGTEGIEEFNAEYEYVGKFLQNDDFYQGLNMTTVIRRKSDGKLFGYFWFDDISKHGQAYVEPNGEEHGIEWDGDEDEAYVWVEVKPFTIVGYTAKEQ